MLPKAAVVIGAQAQVELPRRVVDERSRVAEAQGVPLPARLRGSEQVVEVGVVEAEAGLPVAALVLGVQVEALVGVIEVAVAAGLPLGVIEGHDYAVGALTLEPGESLYLYTDGVTEALDERDEEFSAARLESCLQGVAGRAAPEVVRASLAAVQAFTGGTPPSDDIAVMTLRFLACSTPGPASPGREEP